MSNGRALPALRNIVMFGAPTLLRLLELGHPAFWTYTTVIDTVAPIAPWWTALHVAQVPLFALRGVAVVLLLRDVQGHAALISRCAIAVFIVVYPAFDAAVGIASGVMLQNLSALDAAGRAAVEPALCGAVLGSGDGDNGDHRRCAMARRAGSRGARVAAGGRDCSGVRAAFVVRTFTLRSPMSGRSGRSPASVLSRPPRLSSAATRRTRSSTDRPHPALAPPRVPG